LAEQLAAKAKISDDPLIKLPKKARKIIIEVGDFVELGSEKNAKKKQCNGKIAKVLGLNYPWMEVVPLESRQETNDATLKGWTAEVIKFRGVYWLVEPDDRTEPTKWRQAWSTPVSVEKATIEVATTDTRIVRPFDLLNVDVLACVLSFLEDEPLKEDATLADLKKIA